MLASLPIQAGVPLGSLLRLPLDLFQLALLGRLLATWAAPRSTHPVITLLEAVTEPVLKPIRQVVPPMGQVDVSGVFAFLLADVLKYLLRGLGFML